jgi:hypothetical protein
MLARFSSNIQRGIFYNFAAASKEWVAIPTRPHACILSTTPLSIFVTLDFPSREVVCSVA